MFLLGTMVQSKRNFVTSKRAKIIAQLHVRFTLHHTPEMFKTCVKNQLTSVVGQQRTGRSANTCLCYEKRQAEIYARLDKKSRWSANLCGGQQYALSDQQCALLVHSRSFSRSHQTPASTPSATSSISWFAVKYPIGCDAFKKKFRWHHDQQINGMALWCDIFKMRINRSHFSIHHMNSLSAEAPSAFICSAQRTVPFRTTGCVTDAQHMLTNYEVKIFSTDTCRRDFSECGAVVGATRAGSKYFRTTQPPYRGWQKQHEMTDPFNLLSTVQAAGGIIVWDIFSRHTLDHLVAIESRLNGTAWVLLLTTSIPPWTQCTHLLMITASRKAHHTRKLE